MKLQYSRTISLLIVISMLFSLSLTSCKKKKENTREENNTVADGNENQKLPDSTTETTEGKKEIVFAEIIDFNKIQYTISADAKASQHATDTQNIKVYDGERAVSVLNITTNVDATTGIIELGEKLDITKSYSVVIDGYNEKVAIPTFVFDTKEFATDYSYHGDDLGATLNGNRTTFKVWAPTASMVVLNLFKNDTDSAYLSIDMTRGDAGVWLCSVECGHGTYYTYSVTTQIGTNEAADPYAKATDLSGNRGMVVDLSKTNPDGWDTDFKAEIDNYSDAIIWAVNPEEFSASSKFNYSGYLAFTERGLVNESGESIGVDYLVNLGVTHVNLLPVYGFESHTDGDSQKIYSTVNYNSPSNILSSDPSSPDVAIKEYKEMVKALHDAGIGVIVSVDYAHTDSAITSFDKIVPYYYYRYTISGSGKDTASERYMFSKFVTDSLGYLAEEYDLDGFSIETIHLHDIGTIDKIEKTIHSINPNAIIIGKYNVDTDSSATIKEIGALSPLEGAIGSIAIFSDDMSDGLKQFLREDPTIAYAESFASISTSIKGIITGKSGETEACETVNYIGFKDNNLLNTSKGMTEEQKLSFTRLALTLLAVSKGVVYINAGEDFSSYGTCGIDWELLDGKSSEHDTMLRLKELIKIRKSYSIFTDAKTEVDAELLMQGKSVFLINNINGDKARILLNPTAVDGTYPLNGSWYMILSDTEDTDGVKVYEDIITIPAYTAIILANRIPVSD